MDKVVAVFCGPLKCLSPGKALLFPQRIFISLSLRKILRFAANVLNKDTSKSLSMQLRFPYVCRLDYSYILLIYIMLIFGAYYVFHYVFHAYYALCSCISMRFQINIMRYVTVNYLISSY